MRLLSALTNAMTIPLIALAAYCCGGPRKGPLAAVLAAILFAGSGTQLNASQDARPYVFMTLAMTLGLLGSVRIMTETSRARQPMTRLLRRDPGVAAAFACTGTGIALLGWSHNLGTVFGLLLGVALLVWWFACDRSRGLFINLLLAAGLAALLYSPNLPIILMQVTAMKDQGFWLTRPGLANLFRVILQMPLGYVSVSGPQIALGGVAVLAGLAGFVALWRQARAIALLLLFLAVFPTALFFVISRIGQPIFLFRTLQASQVPAIMLISFAPFAFSRYGRAVAAAVPLLVLPIVWSHLTTLERGGEDWRGIVTQIRDQSAGEVPKVIVLPAAAELPLLYYTRKLGVAMELIPLPGAYPARGPGYTYPTGGGWSPAITAEILPDLAQAIGTSGQVWFIARIPKLYDHDMLVDQALRHRFPCRSSAYSYATLLTEPRPDASCPAW